LDHQQTYAERKHETSIVRHLRSSFSPPCSSLWQQVNLHVTHEHGHISPHAHLHTFIDMMPPNATRKSWPAGYMSELNGQFSKQL